MESPRLEVIKSSSDVSGLQLLALSMWLLFSWCKLATALQGRKMKERAKAKVFASFLTSCLSRNKELSWKPPPCRDSDLSHKGVWGGEEF